MVIDPRQYGHATIAERRLMRKNAVPEHAYTGYVPRDKGEPGSPPPVVGKIKNAIVGYRGHRYNKEAMIGTTFTRGLEIVPHPVSLRPTAVVPANRDDSMSASGYGCFSELSGYGQFLGAPRSKPASDDDENNRGERGQPSEYGEMDRGSNHYGQFAAPPLPPGSNYGEFDKESGYGQFAAPPQNPAASGYGEFAKASGYGQFAAPHGQFKAAASGYGEFAKASDYGQFAAPPGKSRAAASGYGEFAKASGYGQFAAPPKGAVSGYGAFEKASGYGQFAAPPGAPRAASGYGEFAKASAYGQFAPPPPPGSGYGKFDKENGYGQFAAPPPAAKATSGYGEFAKASGYGQFAPPPPAPNQDKAVSGYGEFAKESGYGNFAAPPPLAKAASGYGEFAKASGYGQFAASPDAPRATSGYGEFAKASGYGQFAAPPEATKAASAYGEFAKASGYGQFAAPPPSGDNPEKAASGYGEFDKGSEYGQFASPPEERNTSTQPYIRAKATNVQFAAMPTKLTNASGENKSNHLRATTHTGATASYNSDERRRADGQLHFDVFCKNESLRALYVRVVRQLGGASQVAGLFERLFKAQRQKKGSKTEQKQRVKIAFARVTSRDGRIDKAKLHEALSELACVFTDEEVLAMMARFDPSCAGRVRASHFSDLLHAEIEKA
ncbi:Aste57867_18386 [Aphanomyces stellatus]|uniref:Aste57867_18386 protein n=1 Tax=Aphanomyces stellatus TaxID=120398 RepID=A0A485L9Y1_9STRA|nr:hypothetical protein As57867_018324 [Aphanomyces stellatus]VFT95122.1 Aste57867_18386 [Aphanomyces stellatus]